jgi:hypothetical protein
LAQRLMANPIALLPTLYPLFAQGVKGKHKRSRAEPGGGRLPAVCHTLQ